MKKLTFVIGAGASAELELKTGGKFPTGVGIKQKIEKLFSRDGYEDSSEAKWVEGMINAITNNGFSGHTGEHRQECHKISKSLVLAESVDHYINSHQKNQMTVKLIKTAIIKEILEAEKASPLFFNKENPVGFGKITETWYIPFFQMLVRGASIDNIEARLNNLTLIIFNYDRCVEHFLYYAFQGYFRIDTQHAARLVKAIKIYHPYGQAGQLPWMASADNIAFGVPEYSMNSFVADAKYIKTFSEANHDDDHIQYIRAAMQGADVMCFLGFAYYDLNMRLLGLGDPLPRKPKCYLTVYNLSNSDVTRARKYLGDGDQSISINVEHQNVPCVRFFGEYSSAIFNDWMMS